MPIDWEIIELTKFDENIGNWSRKQRKANFRFGQSSTVGQTIIYNQTLANRDV